MFKRFFGKKNDGFYIQLEDADAKSAPVAKAAAKSAPAAPTAEPAVAVPAAKADAKPAKTEKKSAKKAETPKPKVEAAPAPVAAPVPAITNFATDYLIKPSSSSGRRRPGANMRQFVDLARQMDKPKPFKATAVERKPEEKPKAEKANVKATSAEPATELTSK